MAPPYKRQRTEEVIDLTSDVESVYDEDDSPHTEEDSGPDTEEVSHPPRKMPSNDTNILNTLYGSGGGTVAITFGADRSTTYDFPRGLLTAHFRYFRLALQTRPESREAVFAEGENSRVHLEGIDAGTFATLHRWVSERATDGYYHHLFRWALSSAEDRDVTHLLDVAVAADYLGLEEWARELEVWLNHGIAKTVLDDRRAVTQAVMDFVREHRAFRSGLFWATIVKAGVRPALQEKMLTTSRLFGGGEDGGKWVGHRDGIEEWLGVLEHCQRLRRRRRNVEYAAAVLEEVMGTMLAASLRGETVGGRRELLVYHDPMVEVFEERFVLTGVDHDFII
jgi:hypothetical protein